MIANKALVIAGCAALLSLGAPAFAAPGDEATPTCSDTLGIEVHGQHVIGDYVMGTGTDWPPSGAEIGQTVSDNGGVAIAGGPGPGFHFPNGFAPGASFCTGSQSPGTHL